NAARPSHSAAPRLKVGVGWCVVGSATCTRPPDFDIQATIPVPADALQARQMSWHTTPKRWFLVTLAGQMEITTSDGETRCFGPGSVWLLDDTTGKGHNTRVLAGNDWYGFGVDLAEQSNYGQ